MIYLRTWSYDNSTTKTVAKIYLVRDDATKLNLDWPDVWSHADFGRQFESSCMFQNPADLVEPRLIEQVCWHPALRANLVALSPKFHLHEP